MQSTLSLKKTDYEAKVGGNAGWGTDPEGWTSDKADIIKDCVESGLRRFYHCGHPWSFLKPFVSLTLRDGATTVELPDDFGGLEGSIIATFTGGTVRKVKLINPAALEAMHARSSETTGVPQGASLRATKGMRQELYLYPTADEDYTIRIQYYVLPNFLDGAHPYAYGGAEHVETILESCLAIMEERYNDQPFGSHSQRFAQLLEKSKSMDARKSPQYLGENRDRSDDVGFGGFDDYYPPVTVNGIAYGDD